MLRRLARFPAPDGGRKPPFLTQERAHAANRDMRHLAPLFPTPLSPPPIFLAPLFPLSSHTGFASSFHFPPPSPFFLFLVISLLFLPLPFVLRLTPLWSLSSSFDRCWRERTCWGVRRRVQARPPLLRCQFCTSLARTLTGEGGRYTDRSDCFSDFCG